MIMLFSYSELEEVKKAAEELTKKQIRLLSDDITRHGPNEGVWPG